MRRLQEKRGKQRAQSSSSLFSKVKSFFSWLLFLSFLAAIVVGGLFYRRADEKISNVAKRLLDESFPNADVTFDSIRLESTRGVRLRNVAWRPRNSENATPILSADEIYVECPVEIKTLLTRKAAPTRIVITRPQLNARVNLNSALADFTTLYPAESNGRSCPVDVFDAAVILHDGGEQTVFSGVKISFEPVYAGDQNTDAQEEDESDPSIENSTVDADAPNAGAEKLALSKPLNDEFFANVDSYWRVSVEAGNSLVESLKISGRISSGAWDLQGEVEKLDLTTLYKFAKLQMGDLNRAVTNLQGKASFEFAVSSNDGTFSTMDYSVAGECVNALVAAPMLKYPCSDLNARFVLANGSFEITRATGMCGLTSIAASYRQQGALGQPTAATTLCHLENAPISNAIVESLARSAKEGGAADAAQIDSFLNFVDDYQFSATTNVELALEKNEETGGVWKPAKIVFTGKNVDFSCNRFPYQISNLEGVVSLDKAGTLNLALKSQTQERPFLLQGQFLNALAAPRGVVDVVAKDVPVDAKLLVAIPENARIQVERLHPTGLIDVNFRLLYDPALYPNDPLKLEAAVNARNASLQYDLFPMPITSINGQIYMRDGVWSFSNLSGKSGAASITAVGSVISGAGYEQLSADFDAVNRAKESGQSRSPDAALSPAPPQFFTSVPAIGGAPLAPDAWRVLITANVGNFPLGEELRSALVHYENAPSFEKLRLEGKTNGQIRVGYRTDEKKLRLQFDATPIASATSCQPFDLPFAFKDVEGRVSYREGVLTISGLRARNGRTTYSANVVSHADASGAWIADISSLRVDQFQIDRDLQSAAPTQGRQLFSFLQPSGFFNIDGALRITKGSEPNAKCRVAWNLRLVAQQNAARPGVNLDSICGRVRTFGVAVEQGAPLVYGEFDLDSMYYNDVQLANVKGPFFYNGTDLFWGREAPAIRKSALYLDPYVKQCVDADPFYQQPVEGAWRTGAHVTTRGQAPTNSSAVPTPGFAVSATPSQNAAANYANSQNANPPAQQTSGAPVQLGVAPVSTDPERRPIRATVFGGTLVADGVFFGREEVAYRFGVNLQQCALDDVTRAFAPGSKPLKGRLDAYANLYGQGKSVATLKGQGSARVQDAELYELPQIVKILQILSVQEPDKNAFNSSSVDFQVFGDRVKLNRVVLEGDALSLYGDGWLTIHEQERLVDLTFSSRLGNSQTQIPIISDVFGAAGDQLAQIRVEGNLASPVVQQESLPGLKKAWWSVFPEQEPTPTDKAPVERAKPVRDAWRKIIGADNNE